MVYVIAQLSIHDRARYDRYAAGFMEVLRRFGGRLLVSDESPRLIGGDRRGPRHRTGSASAVAGVPIFGEAVCECMSDMHSRGRSRGNGNHDCAGPARSVLGTRGRGVAGGGENGERCDRARLASLRLMHCEQL